MELTDTLFLGARVCLSAVFIYSGIEKLMYRREAMREMRGFGLPWPSFALAGAIALQLTAGTMVLLGVHARLGALLLLAFTAAATLVGHPFWKLRGAAFRKSLTTTFEHVAMIGGLLAIAAAGPGAFSLS